MSDEEQRGIESSTESASDNPEAVSEINDTTQNAVSTTDIDEVSEEITTETSEGVDSAVEEERQKEPPLPPHFTPIPEEKLVQAKKTKRVLITVIVLLAVLLFGAGAAAGYYYLDQEQASETIAHTDLEIESGAEGIKDRGTVAVVEMPDLAEMFGKTPEEVISILGADYRITKTDTAPTEEEADEESESTAQQVVTVSYTPLEQASTASTNPVQKIYLSLDESGTTVEVYFISSMGLLDYPAADFGDLVSTKDVFVDALTAAGISVPSNIDFTPPTKDEYTVYVDPEAAELRIKKETASFSGLLDSEHPPASFEVTFTYEYKTSGVEDVPNKQPSQRMLYIKLG